MGGAEVEKRAEEQAGLAVGGVYDGDEQEDQRHAGDGPTVRTVGRLDDAVPVHLEEPAVALHAEVAEVHLVEEGKLEVLRAAHTKFCGKERDWVGKRKSARVETESGRQRYFP